MLKIPYPQVMRSLMYTMRSTKLDICHAVELVGRYQSNPDKKYLQNSKVYIKVFTKYQKEENVFWNQWSGINWLYWYWFRSDVDDKISTSGQIFLFGGKTISLLSKK